MALFQGEGSATVTSGNDYVFGTGPGSVNASPTSGNDFLVGGYNTGGLFSGISGNNSVATAFSLEIDDRWIEAGRYSFIDANAPSTTIHIDGEDAVEFFSVSVGANETITIDVDLATFDSFIQLIGPDGTTVLASNDDSADDIGSINGTDSFLSFTTDAAGSGTYFIVIGGSDSGTLGSIAAGAEGLVNVTVTGHVATGEAVVSNDDMRGGAGNDFVFGGDGDDQLHSGSDDDILDGGAGDDTLFFGTGNNILIGGEGSDTYNLQFLSGVQANIDLSISEAQSIGSGTVILDGIENIFGSNSSDTLTGDENANILSGRGGNDVLNGGADDDELFGGDGDDTLNGGTGNDRVDGGIGNDVLNGDEGDDTIFGGTGNDLFDGGAGVDTAVFGGRAFADIDVFINADGNIVLIDRFGDEDILTNIEFVQFQDQTRTIAELEAIATPLVTPTEGDDAIEGTFNDDTIDGLGGNDVINGREGNDTLSGNIGDDMLAGGVGDDVLDGGEGQDTASFGGNANDYLIVDNGDGTVSITDLIGSDGTDTLSNIETLSFDDGNVALADLLAETIILTAEDDNFTGSEDDERINGLDGNDTIRGEAGEDIITGGAGNDSLFGGTFSDILFGDDGNDTLIGGFGRDTIFGGAGNDRIVITNEDGQTHFNDNIDGGSGTDTLDFTGYDLTSIFINVDLAAGTYSSLGGTSTITSVENVTGSDLDDTITGNDGNNVLNGAGGDDVLNGGGGNDTFNGGTGNDIIDGGAGNDTLNLSGGIFDYAITDNGDGTFTAEDLVGTDGTDTLTNIETLGFRNVRLSLVDGTITLGNGADNFIGSESDDIIFALNSSDRVEGRGGDDTIDGGNGNDTLLGEAGNDTLLGQAGTDTLNGGEGDDVLDGGAGTDLATYENATSGVTVDLANDQAQDTFGAGVDTIRNIENLTGSAFDDDLFGTDGDNIINGGAGDDEIIGDTGEAPPASGIGFGSGELVREAGAANTDIATAIDISNLFSLDANPDIANAERDAHVTITGTGDGDDSVHFYQVTITAAGSIITLDTDDSGFVDFDTEVSILDADGNVLANDDDSLTTDGAGGSTSSLDSFLTFTVPEPGTYFIAMGRFAGGSDFPNFVRDGQSYRLHVSVTEPVNNPDLGLFPGDDILNGGEGNDRIEGVFGNDVLNGGEGDDELFGGEGNDILSGGTGNDAIDGGEGTDIVTYADATAGVTVDLSTEDSQDTGGAGFDTLRNIETLTGSDFDDVLSGDFGNNTITGGEGNDVINGRGGVDTVVLSDDVADYIITNNPNRTITLTADVGSDGTDNIRNVEFFQFADVTLSVDRLRDGGIFLTTNNDDFTGGDLDDVINGLAGNDTLDGGIGNDVLNGDDGDDRLTGGLDDDILNGGEGVDTASYADGTAGVSVDLSLSDAQDTLGAGIDTLNSIENLTGSAFDDVLLGNAENNELAGGEGDDSLNGGAGSDTVIFAGSVLDYAFTFNPDGSIVVTDTVGTQGSDTVSNFEFFRFDDVTIDLQTLLRGGTFLNNAANTFTATDDDDIVSGLGGNDTINGGAGNDLLFGDDGRDTLNGDAGNDTLFGGSNNDTLNGGEGDDILIGGFNNDTINGGAGDDTIIIENELSGSTLITHFNDTIDGGDGIDTLDFSGYSFVSSNDVQINVDLGAETYTAFGGTQSIVNVENVIGSIEDDILSGNDLANILIGNGGDDTLSGAGGDDTLFGNAGDDTLNGGDGDDTLIGSIGSDTLIGGDGFDHLFGGSGNDTLSGGAGDDRLFGGIGSDNLSGDSGADILRGGENRDIILGGVGNDRLFGDAGNDVLGGEDGNDQLLGGDGHDTLFGGSGNDTVFGEAGDDILNGGTGEDLIRGDSGDDLLNGDAGNDRLFGDSGNDLLNGGTGDDILAGGMEDDTLRGGTGNDRLLGEAGNDILGGDSGNDDLLGGTGNDRLFGALGNDILFGGEGKDRLFGGAHDDLLRGGTENDQLFGEAGDDRLFGDDGDDLLSGGEGTDVMTGGRGADSFAYSLGSGTDAITDFGFGADVIVVDAALGVSGFDDLQIVQRGDNTLIRLEPGGEDALVLFGVDAGSLTADNFVFNAPEAPVDTVIVEPSDDLSLLVDRAFELTGQMNEIAPRLEIDPDIIFEADHPLDILDLEMDLFV